jgi:hypothetical protein
MQIQSMNGIHTSVVAHGLIGISTGKPAGALPTPVPTKYPYPYTQGYQWVGVFQRVQTGCMGIVFLGVNLRVSKVNRDLHG